MANLKSFWAMVLANNAQFTISNQRRQIDNVIKTNAKKTKFNWEMELAKSVNHTQLNRIPSNVKQIYVCTLKKYLKTVSVKIVQNTQRQMILMEKSALVTLAQKFKNCSLMVHAKIAQHTREDRRTKNHVRL